MTTFNLNLIKVCFSLLIFLSINTYAEKRISSSPNNADAACAEYDPDDARLPSGNCEPAKETIKYDPDCARLYGCSDKNTQKGPQDFSAKGGNDPQPIGLLLPAVQKARDK
ncbi:MAG: hypothetical protein K6L81_14075 [Agarilytica sp.]